MSDSDTKTSSILVAREAFDSAVATTAQLVEAGILWWRITGSGLEPRLDAQKVESVLADDKRKAWQRILRNEIVMALDIELFNQPMMALMRMRGPGDVSKEDTKEFRTRIELVKARLITPGLEQRAVIRRTCKGPALDNIKWDISVKKHDLEEGKVNDVPYATLELVYSEGGEIVPTGYRYFLNSSGEESIHFDCHAEDLDALIRDLEQVRDNLRRLSPPQP